MKHSMLFAVFLASASAAASPEQPTNSKDPVKPERCSEAYFDYLVDEAAKAEEQLVALEATMGPSPSEKESARLLMARADSAAAHADAFAARRECNEQMEQSSLGAQSGGL